MMRVGDAVLALRAVSGQRREIPATDGRAPDPHHMKLKSKSVILVASGDLRLSANQVCWPAQAAMEKALGEIVWSRICVKNESLHMDIGRGGVAALPREETERRWQLTTPQWPIMHAVTYGVTRDQFMAKHQANHIQVAYANDAKSANECLVAKAAFASALGMKVNVCGTPAGGGSW